MATIKTVQEEATDLSGKPIERKASADTLKRFSSQNCLALGLHCDRLVGERRHLHQCLDSDGTDASLIPRHCQNYIDISDTLFLKGAILAEGHDDTFTSIVLRQMRCRQRLFAGGTVVALDVDEAADWAAPCLRRV